MPSVSSQKFDSHVFTVRVDTHEQVTIFAMNKSKSRAFFDLARFNRLNCGHICSSYDTLHFFSCYEKSVLMILILQARLNLI